MAAAVPLDSNGHGGTYKLVGGAPSLDFANLVSYRGSARAHDWLDPPGNLARWQDATGLRVRASVPTSVLVDLREALATVFLAVAAGGDPPGPAFDAVAAAAAGARARQHLVWDAAAGRAAWRLPAARLDDLLALDAADLLSDERTRSRLGACAGCGWVYLDTTRNRSRRWCDPADCGNRARQRRHYARRR